MKSQPQCRERENNLQQIFTLRSSATLIYWLWNLFLLPLASLHPVLTVFVFTGAEVDFCLLPPSRLRSCWGGGRRPSDGSGQVLTHTHSGRFCPEATISRWAPPSFIYAVKFAFLFFFSSSCLLIFGRIASKNATKKVQLTHTGTLVLSWNYSCRLRNIYFCCSSFPPSPATSHNARLRVCVSGLPWRFNSRIRYIPLLFRHNRVGLIKCRNRCCTFIKTFGSFQNSAIAPVQLFGN